MRTKIKNIKEKGGIEMFKILISGSLSFLKILGLVFGGLALFVFVAGF